jgi:hypothetical protein
VTVTRDCATCLHDYMEPGLLPHMEPNAPSPPNDLGKSQEAKQLVLFLF